ncbi:MAG TPA: hypothetical protein P5026_09510 [Kiritimatiellia bacterium]|nr:hypothetical protein [Kiritimatiellia bacterium]HRU71082.1 hypothetical protein [Kiritimatiellia bacterium]
MTLHSFFYSTFRLPRLVRLTVVSLFLSGCASWTFTPLRESRFINVDAEQLQVEYGREKRTETLDNGLVCTYEGKVRLTLPDGTRLILYQTLATTGIRYLSSNKQYEFVEKAPYCILRHQGRVIFEGIYLRQ